MTRILPPRPLPIGRQLTNTLVPVGAGLVMGVAAIAGGFIVGGGMAWEIWADQSLWRRGVPAKEVRVEGHVTTKKLVWHSYNLTARWRDEKGAVRQHKVNVETLFGGLDQRWPPELRYEPHAPE